MGKILRCCPSGCEDAPASDLSSEAVTSPVLCFSSSHVFAQQPRGWRAKGMSDLEEMNQLSILTKTDVETWGKEGKMCLGTGKSTEDLQSWTHAEMRNVTLTQRCKIMVECV